MLGKAFSHSSNLYSFFFFFEKWAIMICNFRDFAGYCKHFLRLGAYNLVYSTNMGTSTLSTWINRWKWNLGPNASAALSFPAWLSSRLGSPSLIPLALWSLRLRRAWPTLLSCASWNKFCKIPDSLHEGLQGWNLTWSDVGLIFLIMQGVVLWKPTSSWLLR